MTKLTLHFILSSLIFIPTIYSHKKIEENKITQTLGSQKIHQILQQQSDKIAHEINSIIQNNPQIKSFIFKKSNKPIFMHTVLIKNNKSFKLARFFSYGLTKKEAKNIITATQIENTIKKFKQHIKHITKNITTPIEDVGCINNIINNSTNSLFITLDKLRQENSILKQEISPCSQEKAYTYIVPIYK